MATKTRAAAGEVAIREAVSADAEACARICFDAFGGIQDHHRFPRDFPVLEAATGLMGNWIPHPSVWGVVAEVDGRIVGSNFLDERSPIRVGRPAAMSSNGWGSGRIEGSSLVRDDPRDGRKPTCR